MTIEEVYKEHCSEYEKAVTLVKVWLDFLKNDSKLISKIEDRIKSLESLTEKCERKNVSPEEIQEKIHDWGGIRLICKHRKDATQLVKAIKTLQLPGFSVVHEKNYNLNPKKNGYSGYHLDCQVTVPTVDGNKPVPIEIQIRTTSQDTFAVIEHDHYKEMVEAGLKYEDDDPETNKILRKIADCCKKIDELADTLNTKATKPAE